MYTMIPFHGRMRRAGDSALDDLFFRSLFDMSDWIGSAGFRVDIRENDASYLLEAELPGVDEKDIDLTVEDHEMTISANLNAERQDDRNCYSERRCGHVSRTFSLEGIDESHIIASHKNGILYVTLQAQAPGKDKRPPYPHQRQLRTVRASRRYSVIIRKHKSAADRSICGAFI